MVEDSNQNPEQKARDKIDQMLREAGWKVQSQDKADLHASKGVAIREYYTDAGPADYVLFLNRKPVGIIEAKREEEGHRLTMAEDQSKKYATAKLKHRDNDPLFFAYESTGIITRFTDYRDPKPRGRLTFSFHRPETMELWLKQDKTLRARLKDIPPLDPEGLRPAQVEAIEKLEISFQKNRPKALIQMATGAGKTFTTVNFVYRLLKYAKAHRILFLVDTKNLGEQAEQEFIKFQPNDEHRKFTELYNVQRLNSSYIASDSHVCISTIQRLYAILKGKELEESAELENPNESTWLQEQMAKKEPLPVVYNEKVPIEQFDFIVIDECHRSIYNLWKQVLDYFDAFLIGLTATPHKRTLGFFNENLVSDYTYEQSVIDGVNVPYDIYRIETEISKNGATVKAGWHVDRRDKQTRKTRWQKEDEDTVYGKKNLDGKVVSKSQIRHVIREFRAALERDIFPHRKDENGDYEVPKALIFAKTDSHADDIIDMVRKEFDEGNEFCKKITYKISEDPESLLNRFRNEYYPRIAVTVDMIATGTDVKPLEILLFMRDVRSSNYFEQMRGRGTRTIDKTKLQKVTKTAHAKTHFVLVDAIGVTQSKKNDSRSLERRRGIALKELLGAVTMGVEEEDLFLSLANRLMRLDRLLTNKEKEKVPEYAKGKSLKAIIKGLISAYDPDAITDLAKQLKKQEHLPSLDMAREVAQEALITEASAPFNGELNEYLVNVLKEHEQIIDTINIDTVTQAEWDKTSTERAQAMVTDFRAYMEEHKDEIEALSIFYNQPYRLKEVTYRMIKELLEKLKSDQPLLAPANVWEAYLALNKTQHARPQNELTALVALIREVSGLDKTLTPYDKRVNKNFKDWIFQQNAGQPDRFTEAQMNWLRMIKDHIASSIHLEIEDLDLTPFDAAGGRGKMWQLFGEDMHQIIEEMNETLVA